MGYAAGTNTKKANLGSSFEERRNREVKLENWKAWKLESDTIVY
jgi:hypothetical protein